MIIKNPENALQRLAAACAKTEYCEADIRRKLSQWGITSEAVSDDIVGRLRSEGYIDDARYCNAFTEEKWRFNRWGRTKIRMALKQKHLPDDLVSNALATIDDEEYQSVLLELLKQKARNLRDEDDQWSRRAKLMRFAEGRGFESDIAKDCIDNMTDE